MKRHTELANRSTCLDYNYLKPGKLSLIVAKVSSALKVIPFLKILVGKAKISKKISRFNALGVCGVFN